MDWIFIGIAIAIGFYLAPLIITIATVVIYTIVGVIVFGIKAIFGGKE
jgi:hypothetical protein